jgi:hypothetical protein
VIDVLCERAKNGEEEFFSRLFFAVAEQYLQTHFLTTEPKGEYTCTVIEFNLPPMTVLFDLRQQIWKQLFQFYQIPTFRVRQRKLSDTIVSLQVSATSDSILPSRTHCLPALQASHAISPRCRFCPPPNDYSVESAKNEIPLCGTKCCDIGLTQDVLILKTQATK